MLAKYLKIRCAFTALNKPPNYRIKDSENLVDISNTINCAAATYRYTWRTNQNKVKMVLQQLDRRINLNSLQSNSGGNERDYI